MRPPLQRPDVERFLSEKGISLDVLANYLVSSLATGVPIERVGVYGRCWQIVQDMLAERTKDDIATRFTDTDVCPECGNEPRITGGKRPVTYCPLCDIRLLEVRRYDGHTYYRWSRPQPIAVALPVRSLQRA